MKILFLTSAHNSLSQRLLIELTARRHDVEVCIASSSEAMIDAVAMHRPDLIVAPMLTKAVPEAIFRNHLCLIVHPGIMGDRGPSSLDWAIQEGEKSWGVTILQAVEEMDAGPIWSHQTFDMPAGVLEADISKSRLYRNEVTEAAVRGVCEAVAKFECRCFPPEPLDYGRPDVRGRLRRPIRQSDRAIDWGRETTDAIVRKIGAADSAPGVLDLLLGLQVFLFGARHEDRLRGAPGDIIATRDGAICRATIDGAVWITHLKLKGEPAVEACLHAATGCSRCELDFCALAGIKLPAAHVLGTLLDGVPEVALSFETETDDRTFREIRYVEHGGVGYVHFDFANGAMSTEQCDRLREAFCFARRRPTRVIAMIGGPDFFSNGIHLNVIEAADDPALESWRNINAINDLICEMLNTTSHLVVAGVQGNAGAGGAMMALAADYVFARSGVVFNPHYKGMGGLYGSEYWTYTLPRRVGAARALELTEGLRPMGATEAKSIGFIDDHFGANPEGFERELTARAQALAARADFWHLIRDKHTRRMADEQKKPLSTYRTEELNRMRINFFGADQAYHRARENFVFKGKPPTRAPRPAVSGLLLA